MDDEALQVLREVWRAPGQDADEVVEACGPQRACKNMSAVGFGGLAENGDLHAAWHDQLAREGKLTPGTTTVRDLVLGPDDQPDPPPDHHGQH
ncbi:hypothetical protein VSH64_14900 [Amycolatopsis rhabdoformis]|uniref:DUF222 domain-containing protein n=1 Tax=Amycolatopsis rhabdoformis TaxID=1448059 RepID=A0ABZ1IGY3_9PSEU|nr:hypothetical protein [Amycolatopsis rhabdoformis]WSE33388.1 hypothetical protein VSH64_14900 [Amycolatopsis rhabdoformis]